jgi:hypothetical protein
MKEEDLKRLNMEKYIVGEDKTSSTYDLTNEKDNNKVLDVYKSLEGDDLICIKKDEKRD